MPRTRNIDIKRSYYVNVSLKMSITAGYFWYPNTQMSCKHNASGQRGLSIPWNRFKFDRTAGVVVKCLSKSMEANTDVEVIALNNFCVTLTWNSITTEASFFFPFRSMLLTWQKLQIRPVYSTRNIIHAVHITYNSTVRRKWYQPQRTDL